MDIPKPEPIKLSHDPVRPASQVPLPSVDGGTWHKIPEGNVDRDPYVIEAVISVRAARVRLASVNVSSAVTDANAFLDGAEDALRDALGLNSRSYKLAE